MKICGKLFAFFSLVLAVVVSLSACELYEPIFEPGDTAFALCGGSFDFSLVSDYSDKPYGDTDEPYCEINGGVPYFSESELTTNDYESYGPLDALGRCTSAAACVGVSLMPTEERGNIGMIKPSGWHTVKYDCVSGKYLYNRCHLIGYQLTGEGANEKNLITGTRYMNVRGMLPFENMVADYVKETNCHVMYRATPIFVGEELLCRGVLLEAYSVEDKGEGICFNVFVYNVQPSIVIDYATGDSHEQADT